MKTQTSKPVRERTSYTKEYKQEALSSDLWQSAPGPRDRCHGRPHRPRLVESWSQSSMSAAGGWWALAMSPILDAPLTSAALRMALRQRQPGRTLIVHSDRGSQFASAAYRQVLAEHGLLASMSRPGNCYPALTGPLSNRSGAASNTSWSITSASPPRLKRAPPSSITSKPL